ncbi:SUKH-4 family immunity protein [Nocardia sp. NPDC005998]|uniref:SUKH-4 family immunity protein n=1 Tax=Nocardia sp. NPDC005998 TaxID=3156894 RepID=UPI0033A78EB7
MDTVEKRLGLVLRAPVDSLVADDRVRMPDSVARWNLPEHDRAALRAWGMPSDMPMAADPQFGVEPELTPTIASDLERRLLTADRRLYRLGRWGRHPLTLIGALAGDGTVFGLRETPLSTTDLPPVMPDRYPDLNPTVAYLNSSVARFLEVAWRWRAASRILRELTETEPPFPGTRIALTERGEDADAIHAAYLEECEQVWERTDVDIAAVLAAMAEIDNLTGPDGRESLWVELINSFPS